MPRPRLTAVQQDVINRLMDGWELVSAWAHYELRKSGQPSRYVARATGDSLRNRRLVQWVPRGGGVWTLA